VNHRVLAEWQKQLADIEIPRPFALDALLANLADARQRALEILTADLGPEVSGLWVPQTDKDVIYLSDSVPSAQHEPIVLHEIGHMVCGHPHDPATTRAVRQQLAPLLDVTQWDKAFARASYIDAAEQEAERFARAVSALARADRRVAARTDQETRHIVSPLLDIFG